MCWPQGAAACISVAMCFGRLNVVHALRWMAYVCGRRGEGVGD